LHGCAAAALADAGRERHRTAAKATSPAVLTQRHNIRIIFGEG